MDQKLQAYIDKLNKLNFKEMYMNDFFLTWEKTDDELEAVFTIADALRYMREQNISTKIFESGLGICIAHELVLRSDNHNVVVRPLDPPAQRTIAMAIPPESEDKPLVRTFAAFVRTWAQKHP